MVPKITLSSESAGLCGPSDAGRRARPRQARSEALLSKAWPLGGAGSPASTLGPKEAGLSAAPPCSSCPPKRPPTPAPAPWSWEKGLPALLRNPCSQRLERQEGDGESPPG